jgi:hypothetical protein
MKSDDSRGAWAKEGRAKHAAHRKRAPDIQNLYCILRVVLLDLLQKGTKRGKERFHPPPYTPATNLSKDDGFFPLVPSLYVQKKEIERFPNENLERVQPIYFWHTQPPTTGFAPRTALRTGIPTADKGRRFRLADV